MGRRKLILFDLDGTLIVMKKHSRINSTPVKSRYRSLMGYNSLGKTMKEGAIEAGLPEVDKGDP
jgi:phosphoserine phosphatase